MTRIRRSRPRSRYDPRRRVTVTLVAAVAANGIIGAAGGMPWHLPADLARFKRLTSGHVLVMGRRTYESIGRPLPGRTTLVVSSRANWRPDGVTVVSSVDEALEQGLAIDEQVFVVGGTRVFESVLSRADRMALTLVDDCPPGDTYFPDVDWSQWVEVHREPGQGLAFVDYIRR